MSDTEYRSGSTGSVPGSAGSVLRRRDFLKTTTLGAAALATGVPAVHSAPSRFRFAFLADLHVMPGEQADRARRAIRMINESVPVDFVITGGDLVQDALAQSEATATRFFDLFSEVISGLKVPVRHTIGNHDLFGVYEESGVSPDHELYGAGMYRRRFGDTHYVFDHGGWHFVVLDGNRIEGRTVVGGVDDAQLAWLAADLERVGPQVPVCIVTHIPLVSSWVQLRHGVTVAPPPQGFIVNNKAVYTVFEPYNVKLVLQGHLHVLEDWRFRGCRFIGAGAVRGGWGPGPLDGPGPSFGVVTVDGGSAAYEHVDVTTA